MTNNEQTVTGVN